jgi:hypothetical protein
MESFVKIKVSKRLYNVKIYNVITEKKNKINKRKIKNVV